MSTLNRSPRRCAREFALQALYQWQLAGMSISDIEAQFVTDKEFKRVDSEYFLQILHGVPAKLDEVDANILLFLDRDINELNPVELAILRIGVYEFLFCQNVPYRVVINEALELAKKYGAVEGFKYVNAVLDKIAKSLEKK